jgi:hypothetical protein
LIENQKLGLPASRPEILHPESFARNKMQNAMMTFHTNIHFCPSPVPAPVDDYRTRTGDETALLKPPAALPVPKDQCPDCNARGRMIPAEKAATICQCSRRTIYRWIEEGALHFRELPDGTVLVCGVTLTAKLELLEDATGHLPS